MLKRISIILCMLVLVFHCGCYSVAEREIDEAYTRGYEDGFHEGYTEAEDLAGDFYDRELGETKAEISEYKANYQYSYDDMSECYVKGFMEGMHRIIMDMEDDHGMSYDYLIEQYYDSYRCMWDNFDYKE